MEDVCERCGSTKNLQKHHLSYDPEIIGVLCVDCHVKLHKHGVGSPNVKINMVKISCEIPDDIDKKFRDEVLKRYGYKKGNLSKALIEAIKMWIKWEENLTEDERKVMDAAIYPPSTD